MGPGNMAQRGSSSSEPFGGMDCAPPLLPGQDRQKWRRDVTSWMDFISRRAHAGEKKSAATLATLAYVLYGGLHSSYQNVLDHARDRGFLKFDADASRQRAVVEQIIDLIGRDTPLETINRLLNAYQKVHTCVRYDTEQPSKYATRFRGLASLYLSLAGVSARQQESQLLAMVMLQNARLSQDTQNAVKLQLVTQSEQNGPSSRLHQSFTVSADTVAILAEKLDSLRSKFSAAGSTEVQEPQGQATDHGSSTVRLFGQESFNEISELISTVQDRLRATTEQSGDSTTSRIFLDDAHSALQSLDSPLRDVISKTQEAERFIRPADLEKAVQKAAMLAVKGLEKNDAGKAPSPEERSRRVRDRKKRTKRVTATVLLRSGRQIRRRPVSPLPPSTRMRLRVFVNRVREASPGS